LCESSIQTSNLKCVEKQKKKILYLGREEKEEERENWQAKEMNLYN
jgi:hypothetical protein